MVKGEGFSAQFRFNSLAQGAHLTGSSKLLTPSPSGSSPPTVMRSVYRRMVGNISTTSPPTTPESEGEGEGSREEAEAEERRESGLGH